MEREFQELADTIYINDAQQEVNSMKIIDGSFVQPEAATQTVCVRKDCVDEKHQPSSIALQTS